MRESGEGWGDFIDDKNLGESIDYKWVIAKHLDRIMSLSEKNPAYYSEGVEQLQDLIECYMSNDEKAKIDEYEDKKKREIKESKDKYGKVGPEREFRIIRNCQRKKIRLLMTIAREKGLIPRGEGVMSIGSYSTRINREKRLAKKAVRREAKGVDGVG
jgi:hypothetical protein